MGHLTTVFSSQKNEEKAALESVWCTQKEQLKLNLELGCYAEHIPTMDLQFSQE